MHLAEPEARGGAGHVLVLCVYAAEDGRSRGGCGATPRRGECGRQPRAEGLVRVWGRVAGDCALVRRGFFLWRGGRNIATELGREGN